MSNIKNPTLTGTETAVQISGQNAAVRNDGTDIIYVSAKPGIVAGADGVVSIPVGQSVVLSDIHGAVYMLGTGGATVIGSDCYENPFKTSAQAGGSGADEVARTAISTHSSNAEIHVTAEEKAAWNGKAELSDIPETLPANGGNADIARETVSPNAKAKLWEDSEGGNLRLVSPDGNHSVEMDLYDNAGFRMYFTDNGELTFPVDYNSTTKKFNINGNADTVDELHGSDLARITDIIGGLRRGWATNNTGVIMKYADREVVKTSNDLSYVGWTINGDGWFNPIIVSQASSGTSYTMWGQNCGYDYLPASEPREGALITYKGRKYYACWQNPGSTPNPNVVGGVYVELTDGDFVKACKTLIDLCENIDADTVDGLNASDLVQNMGFWSGENIQNLILANNSGCVFIDANVTGMPLDGRYWFGFMNNSNGFKQLTVCQLDANCTRYITYNGVDGQWSAWMSFADGGNAASVGAYTEEAIASLEARIAALEAK